jgi:hypothetical protein
MNDSQKNEGGPVIAWQSFMPFMPLPDTVQHEEDLQGAMRGDMALFDEVNKKARAWVDRRRVAIETGLKAIGEMSVCSDPVSAAAIYGRWFIGSLNGIAVDLQEAQDFAVKATAIGQSTARSVVEGFLIDPKSRA